MEKIQADFGERGERQVSEGPRFRSILDHVQAYHPGKVPVSADGKAYKMSSNETPFAPLPSVVDAIAAAAAQCNRYPDNAAQELVTAIAQRFDVPTDDIAVGCGSVGLTQQLLEAVGEPGAEVLYAWRSFEAYPILADLSGARSVRVPLRDDTHDLRAMAEHLTDATRLVLVCNPNNPTGTVVGRDAIVEFLDQVPPTCLVVLDEAYHHYVRDPEVPDGLTLYRDRPNLVVLRTFSKAYGLAGLRVGYLVAHAPVAEAVRKTMLPFTVNHVAQAAAIASLEAEDELAERVEATIAERERLSTALRELGWAVPRSETNFVWLPTGPATPDFAAACFDAGIAVRPFGDEGTRITVDEPEAGDALLDVVRGFRVR